MTRFVVKRVLLAIPSLIGITLITFVLIRLIPGSAIEARFGTSIGLTDEQLRVLRHYFGLDVPIWKHYFLWLGALLRGDLGVSLRTGQPVTQLVSSTLPVTLELAAWAMLIAVAIGVPIGVLSALRPGTWLDGIGRVGSLIGLCLPAFWLGTLVILFFSRVVTWLPNASSYTPLFQDPVRNIEQNVQPAVVLAIGVAGALVRVTRAAVLDVLGAEFVVTARAKGLPSRRILTAHVIRNALIPVITLGGVLAGYLLTGAVIVEQIFNIPGLGRLVLTSILQRDYPVVEGAVLLIATAFVLVNLLTDVVYGFADPRIRQA